MILNSLKSRMVLSITGIVVVSLVITIFFFAHRAKLQLYDAIEDSALNILEAKKNHVESQYESINYHKSTTLSRRKAELKNNTIIGFAIIKSAYGKFKNGIISEDAAKQQAIEDLKELRYDDGIGYFWINDTTRPYPVMVMHPTIPELDGKILDNPEFNCALGKNENLFKAFVAVCLEKKEGYVDYLWPKPLPEGLTEEQPKISYVKLFKPWNWIMGTGVYIDDIEKDVQARIDAVIEDLNKTILRQSVGESGYFFIFNEENYTLVHPNRAGTDGNEYINPETGNLLLNEIKERAFASDHSMEYLWDKPGHTGEYIFPKKVYVTYFEPLGWYICSSVYIEEFQKKISKLTNRIILFSTFFLALALVISLLISESITNPLNTLIQAIGKTDNDGIPIDTIPETGTTEIKLLGATIKSMIDSVTKSREALWQSESKFRGLINSMPSVLVAVDSNGIVTQWNTEAERITGKNVDEAVGQPFVKAFPRLKTEIDRVFKAMETREVVLDTKRLRKENGETLYEDLTLYPLIANNVEGAVIRIDDVTEQVRLEKMMIQSEKMLSVGGLAAGMAHEINNPLAGMMQTAYVMKIRLTDMEIPANKIAAEEAGISLEGLRRFMETRGVLRMLDSINKSGQRAAEIVGNMLSFARQSDYAVSSNDLSELIDKTLELAATDYDLKKQYDFKTIEIIKEYQEGLPLVPCESAKIQQVLLNILRNGAQAMQEGNMKSEGLCFILRLSHEKAEGMVRIEIDDNGPGMTEDIRRRVFEPFFTTKPVGVGTGLGLSVSYFIIAENHGGTMAVESEPGKGANFIIRLPVKRVGIKE